jgi:Flp pilus assembly protein TadD
LLKLHPDHVDAWNFRGSIRSEAGDIAGAILDHEQARAIDPRNPATLNYLAWLRATTTDSRLADVEQALEDARVACDLTHGEMAGFLDTLAVAQAANGLFDEAIETQNRALDIASEEQLLELRSRLQLYREHKPYRV